MVTELKQQYAIDNLEKELEEVNKIIMVQEFKKYFSKKKEKMNHHHKWETNGTL